MKLVLINPAQRTTSNGNLPKYVDSARGAIPPLGLLYTAAAVQNTGWQVSLVDMAAGQTLGTEKPDLVGITATSFTLLDVLEVARQVKQRWDVPVVVGGIHPTIYPEETANLPNVDCAYSGESEETFPQFIDAIAKGRVQTVWGVSVDAWPRPAYELLDLNRYYSTVGKQKRLVSMFTSRGCPYRCIFCHRLGKKFRAEAAHRVIEGLEHLNDIGVREVLFYDDTFTVDRDRAESIARTIIHRKSVQTIAPDFTFDIRARVDTVDEDLLGYLKEAGCARIHYGVEASSNRVLKVLRKGITVEQVETAFRLTRKIGIETLAYFILGSPTETREDINRTIRWAQELKPDYAHFAVMTPYPATPLYQKGLGELYDDYWLEFARNPQEWEAPYWPEIERETLNELRDRAYAEFYLRPGFILKELARTRSVRQLVNKGRSALGMVKQMYGNKIVVI